jgi:hypothetical protein
MTNILTFNTDEGVHEAGKDDCKSCLDSYPQPHACGGLIHAALRYDVEAGFTWTYKVLRCDNCAFQTTEEVKPQDTGAQDAAAAAPDATSPEGTPTRRYLLSGDVTQAARVSTEAATREEAVRKAEAGDFVIEERVEKGADFTFDGDLDEHIEEIES